MIPATKKFSNYLSDAEAERLAILLEELGEAQQAIGKILRHGYNSRNPIGLLGPDEPNNRTLLVKELGDIYEAVLMMSRAGDVQTAAINARQAEKHEKIKPYLHHQEATR